jgi:VWFA-related protein
MRGRIRCAAALVIFANAAALQHAQAPQSGAQFRGGVEYVEVNARVVDANGEPIRGLTQRDFQVFEDGVRQDVRTFFVVDIPLPSAAQAIDVPIVKPDVATNVRAASSGRTYLIVFDALQVSPVRTLLVRKVLHNFIERSVGPDDLLGVVSLGYDRAFENFTRDKVRMLAAVGALIGQSAPSPTVAAANDIVTRADRSAPAPKAFPNSPPIDAAITDDARQSMRRLAEIVQLMSTAGEGSKAIIYVSESMPFNPTLGTETLSFFEATSLIPDIERVSMAVRRGNVPIYAVYPRGLTDGTEDGIEVGLGGAGAGASLLAEARRQQDNLRVMADDSGGVAIVGTNDLAGGLERVVRLSSSYYVLGYNSKNSKADGKYHRVNVTVARPDARVLSRKGYTAPRVVNAKSTPPLAGPPGSSLPLREALNAALPVPTLPLSIAAAAFRSAGGHGETASIVLETPGVDLEPAENKSGAVLEMTAAALEPRGAIRTGEHGRVQVEAASDAMDRVRRSGFRWVTRLDGLRPGRYQIRGAVSNSPTKQGSVWYDLEIPDFEHAPLAMSDVVLAATTATADRVTLQTDKRLAAILPFPPTASRDFSSSESIAIYVEVYDNGGNKAHDIETSVAIVDERGGEKSRFTETRAASNGLVRIGTRVALGPLSPGTYTLVVEARQAANRAISAGRAVPFRVILR